MYVLSHSYSPACNVSVLFSKDKAERIFIERKDAVLPDTVFLARVVQKKGGASFLDIGGGSIQLSLFDKGVLNTTQNLKLGVLRLRERLGHINTSPSRMEELIEELDDAQLSVLYKLYLKDKNISNIILVDDYLSPWLKNGLFSTEAPGYVSVSYTHLRAHET